MKKISFFFCLITSLTYSQIRDINGNYAADEDSEALTGKISIINNLDVLGEINSYEKFSLHSSSGNISGGLLTRHISPNSGFYIGDIYDNDVPVYITAFGNDNSAASVINLGEEGIYFRTQNTTAMFVNDDQKISIGSNASATERLHLFSSNLMLQSDDSETLRIKFKDDADETLHELYVEDEKFNIGINGSDKISIKSNGSIGINTSPEDDTQLCVSTTEKVGIKSITNHNVDYQFGILSAVNRENTKALSVLLLENGDYVDKFAVMGNGKVLSTEVEVKVPIFPDYVFNKNYDLLPLSELKKFIKKNKHLPNIPPADEVITNGLELGNMQVKQMEKIEELTLYILEQEERIQKLEALVTKLISEKK